MSTTTDTADRYRRLADHFTRIVDAVEPAAWTNPSPCEGWTTADVFAHVVDTQLDFLARMPFAPNAQPGGDVRSRWEATRSLVQSALDAPAQAAHAYEGYFGPTTFAAVIDQFYAADLVVHGWDIARAAGVRDLEPIATEEMTRIRDEYASLGDAMRQPGLFDPELAVAADASQQERFLAWLGRK